MSKLLRIIESTKIKSTHKLYRHSNKICSFFGFSQKFLEIPFFYLKYNRNIKTHLLSSVFISNEKTNISYGFQEFVFFFKQKNMSSTVICQNELNHTFFRSVDFVLFLYFLYCFPSILSLIFVFI